MIAEFEALVEHIGFLQHLSVYVTLVKIFHFIVSIILLCNYIKAMIYWTVWIIGIDIMSNCVLFMVSVNL